MSFLRHREIYHPDGERRRGSQAAAPAHRSDEFPAGYSLAGGAPAEPAAASPAADRISGPRQQDNRISANGELSLLFLSQGGGPLQEHNAPFSGRSFSPKTTRCSKRAGCKPGPIGRSATCPQARRRTPAIPNLLVTKDVGDAGGGRARPGSPRMALVVWTLRRKGHCVPVPVSVPFCFRSVVSAA